jgi:hypothetical protein
VRFGVNTIENPRTTEATRKRDFAAWPIAFILLGIFASLAWMTLIIWWLVLLVLRLF